jgi:nucleoside phosphorylase
MKNVLITCAMEKEGRQIAKKLQMIEISQDLFENKEKNQRLLITGIGKQLTAINLTKYLSKNDKPDLIINVGYAGSTDIQIGKWVNISRVYNYEWEIPGEEKYVMLAGGSQKLELLNNDEIETVECYTSESFVTETDIEEHVAFDMELHSVSLICDLYEIPLVGLKKISDNLSLDNYYENLNTDEVFELTSCIGFLNL